MKILHLVNHCRFGHGNVHAAVDLACAQSAAGDQVTFASGSGDFERLFDQHGIDHVLLDQESRQPLRLIGMLFGLRKLIARTRPDIVHAHMMTGAVVGWAATRLMNVPLVTTVHNAFDNHSVLMGLGDRVIAVSEAVLDIMAGRGVRRTKLRAVLNGTLGAPRRDYFGHCSVTLEHPNVGTICGLHDRKGVRDLLAAFDIAGGSTSRPHLYIAGDGPERAAYEVLAKSLSVADRIHFLGAVADTKSLLQEIDIFVLASHADPAPLVVPEAREGGCAIIATHVDGIPELLNHGRAGDLVPAKDPQALAAAITRLLSDPAALEEGKKRARSEVEYWSTARVAAETRSVYEQLLRT